MDPITQQGLAGSAGAGGDPVYVDDVFSTFLYTGNGGPQTIANGIDLSGEGGLVWIKDRETGYDGSPEVHGLFDTERGVYKRLETNSTVGESSNTESLKSFNSNGFTLGTYNRFTENVFGTGTDYVSWTFRKAPGFFDVVTYTGNGSAGHTISHSLGSVPGMIIIKNTSNSESWQVWHRSVTGNLELDNTGAANTSSVRVNSVTSTSFDITSGWNTSNANGQTYVAYVFAHDDQSFGTNSDEAIIKCGSWSGTSSPFDIDIGFEAQWIMYKSANSTGNWTIVDNMRGLTVQGTDSEALFPNTTAIESGSGNYPAPYAKGFRVITGSQNASGTTYVYMAIRRPHKPPTAGTQVFTAAYASSSQPPAFNSNNHVVDFGIYRRPSTSEDWYTTARLTGVRYLRTNSTAADQNSAIEYDFQHGFGSGASSNYLAYMFSRAPGFFDVVTYKGNATNRTVNHNLEAVPQLILVKGRDFADSWAVYNSVSGATITNTFTSSSNFYASSTRWNDTAPTSTVFSLGTDNSVNKNGGEFSAFLFGSLDGISKVGSYTGTGNNVNVDCGFTAGARFVMVKRMDNNGNWYVWDTTRGIVSGNDSYLSLDTNYSEDTTTDYIDPLNAGFTITSSATSNFNANGVNYLFLAIA